MSFKDLICLTGPSSSGGAPNRPLPPTPDEEESGDRTLVMRRVSLVYSKIFAFMTFCKENNSSNALSK